MGVDGHEARALAADKCRSGAGVVNPTTANYNLEQPGSDSVPNAPG